MSVSFRTAIAGVALCLVAGTAFAQTNLVLKPRVFNDVPDAQFIGSVGGSSAFLAENGVSKASGFANRDDVLFSNDGVTPAMFNHDTPFAFSADVTLVGDPATPRKEAGLRINGPFGNDTLFLINTDAHELVAFGAGSGAGPFNFRTNGLGDYVPGSTINMGMNYQIANGEGQIQYFATQDGKTVTSPFLPFDNMEKGLLNGTTVGMYLQVNNDPNNPNNSGSVRFSNIKIGTSTRDLGLINATSSAIPEPASLSLLAVGLLPLLRRRR